MVQWLGLYIFTAKGADSIPGQGTKILPAMHCSQKKKIKFLGLNPRLTESECLDEGPKICILGICPGDF